MPSYVVIKNSRVKAAVMKKVKYITPSHSSRNTFKSFVIEIL